MQEITYAYIGGLTKSRDDKGFLTVKGLATDDTLDLDQQICDPEWLKTAMPKWFEIGNIREQHDGSKAIGKATSMAAKGTGFEIGAKIVDPTAAMKLEEDVYTGFSIGVKGAYVDYNDTRAPKGVIKGGTIVEVSVVDRPANPSCTLELAKSVDGVLTKSVSMEGDAVHVSNAPEVEVDGYHINCPGCNGTGEVHNGQDQGASTSECEHCHGTGKVTAEDSAQIPTPTATSQDGLVANVENNSLNEGKAADADVEKRDYSDKERADLADKGQALPDGSFPIKTVKDLKNAIQSIGRAKLPAKAKAHIEARAKALGRSDLIPDNWKGADADLFKADTMEHNPAQLNAVRSGLVALIQAELDELEAGEENEICDIYDLVCSLSMFLNWWEDEAEENETTEPFAKTGDDDMSLIQLGVSADLIKAVQADNATEETKSEFKTEFRKALGVDEELTVLKTANTEAKERIAVLEAELEVVKSMAAPSEITLMRPDSRGATISKAQKLRKEAEQVRNKASEITGDPTLRQHLINRSIQLDTEADALEN